MEHLSDGCGIRKTSRLTEVSLGTVARLIQKLGKHALLTHDELVDFPPLTNEVQIDEKWSFVGKKEKNCDPYNPNEDNYRDNWDLSAYDPEHWLILSMLPGKRTIENPHLLV